MMNVLARSVRRGAPLLQSVAARQSQQIRLFSIRYTESHEYIKVEGDFGTVGISQHACDALGDIVYVELPEVGMSFEAGESYGSVESVKAASDVYLPVGGEVVEVNTELETAPETVNESPFDKGWFVKIKVDSPAELDNLMDQEKYDEFKEE